MAERVRHREDDESAARPPDPSLRDRRDRQRKLALQKPRLSTAVPPRLAPVGKQAPPALRCAGLVAVAPLRAGPSCSLPGDFALVLRRVSGRQCSPVSVSLSAVLNG